MTARGFKFREGTTDREIFDSVYENREYGRIHFRNKRVLDVGAHIGSFAALAADLGAEVVHAYEPNTANHELLVLNTRDRPSVVCHNEAIWSEHRTLRWEAGPNTGNTGGGMVHVSDDEKAQLVQAVTLDEVLLAWGPIDVLKLDCEGAEYPILFGSESFAEVPLIVGEYHSHRFDLGTPEKLIEHLSRTHLVVSQPMHDGLGHFTATRMGGRRWKNKRPAGFPTGRYTR